MSKIYYLFLLILYFSCQKRTCPAYYTSYVRASLNEDIFARLPSEGDTSWREKRNREMMTPDLFSMFLMADSGYVPREDLAVKSAYREKYQSKTKKRTSFIIPNALKNQTEKEDKFFLGKKRDKNGLVAREKSLWTSEGRALAKNNTNDVVLAYKRFEYLIEEPDSEIDEELDEDSLYFEDFEEGFEGEEDSTFYAVSEDTLLSKMDSVALEDSMYAANPYLVFKGIKDNPNTDDYMYRFFFRKELAAWLALGEENEEEDVALQEEDSVEAVSLTDPYLEQIDNFRREDFGVATEEFFGKNALFSIDKKDSQDSTATTTVGKAVQSTKNFFFGLFSKKKNKKNAKNSKGRTKE